MKKLLAAAAVMTVMCGVLTGCGNDKNSSVSDNGAPSGASSAAEKTTAADKRDETSNESKTDKKDESSAADKTGSTDASGNYVNDVIDGVESAGKDIVNGVGDAAGDIADGEMGESRTDSTESATSR